MTEKIIFIQNFKTDIGELVIGSFEDKLCLCDWKYRKMRTAIDNRLKSALQAEFLEKESPLIEQTIDQLQEYFTGKRTWFDIPLLLVGTDFQKTVWEELRNIPYGKTLSYMDLALKLHNPKAIRAVASANGANAISIIVPCHRIIGSDGSLVGYAGGLTAKKRLLKCENSFHELF